MDPLTIARYGMRAAEQRFAASASRVVADPQSADLPQEIAEQAQAKEAFTANVGVARVADEMWRALIDIQETGQRPERRGL